ncbi:MAG: hypothetical protein EP315_06300 [Gammaproteobacteria bacterium]|nr:MAG: hypothetical protein EP315_06300 [Gammaproteobacteria bacterium]
MKFIYSVVILMLSLTACSSSGWYQGLQKRKQLKCMNVPQAEYEDCMKATQCS